MINNPSSEIIPIQVLNVKAFLIRTQRGAILVDTGIPFQEKRIIKAFEELEMIPGEIQAIILTHGHLDHIGCLAPLQKRTGATVICHRSILAVLESGGYEEAVPRVAGWKIFNPIISALLGGRLNPVQPDRIFDKSLDLSDFGINGRILHTPGHSPGSCTLLLDNGICFIGDLLREKSPGIFDTGLFYHDRDQILNSLEKIAAHQPRIIYLSHGSTMSSDDLIRFLEENQRLKSPA